MKKILAALLALVMLASFAACGAKGDSGEGGNEEETTVAAATNKNDVIEVEGIYVDNSYVDSDSDALKMVYVFVNINATASNLKADSKYTKMTINGANTYDSDFYKDSCTYAPSYYYSSFIEDVYVGDSFKLALTFKVPEGDLKDSKEIVFSDSDLSYEGIKFTTDDIVFCESAKEIGEKADAEGYAEAAAKHSPADEETEKKVKKLLNGYYWTYYVSAGTTVQTQEIEFFSPNEFEVRSNFGSNGGTYEVMNGYIYVTYSTNGRTYMIPYEIKDGDVELDCATAFSIYE